MKKNLTFHPIIFIKKILIRFNLVLFIVIIVGGLIFSVLTLTDILNQPYKNNINITSPTTPVETTTFDQTTVDRLEKLNTSDNSKKPSLPSDRINPFSG